MTITTGSTRTGRMADRGATMQALVDGDRGRPRLRLPRSSGARLATGGAPVNGDTAG